MHKRNECHLQTRYSKITKCKICNCIVMKVIVVSTHLKMFCCTYNFGAQLTIAIETTKCRTVGE